ncbi:MAG: hypothetical protein PHI90_08105 [Clostridia bacterium]|nr:hypothetical protein [Clostridia bacterium]
MVINTRRKITLIIVFFLLMILGCILYDLPELRQHSVTKQFDSIYYEIIECVDTSDSMGTLDKLYSEQNKNKIAKLGKLLEVIKENAPKDDELFSIIYEIRYEDLSYLVDVYPRINALELEEKRKVFNSLVSIAVDKSEWNDKKFYEIWK